MKLILTLPQAVIPVKAGIRLYHGTQLQHGYSAFAEHDDGERVIS